MFVCYPSNGDNRMLSRCAAQLSSSQAHVPAGAQLDKADLHRATLHGANMASVSGLMQAQLDTACVDEQTKLPVELSHPAPCAAAKTKR